MTGDDGAREGVHVLATDIVRKYGDRTVLEVESFEVPPGDTVALLGPSGSGKSTLSLIIGLLDKQTSGTVKYDERVVTVDDKLGREQVTAVFQRPFLMRGTVEDNVAYGLRLRGVDGSKRSALVAEGLERVGLAGYQDRSAMTLSGGEAQRVALARGLVLKPRLLLLDEPLASLDPLVKRQVIDVFLDVLNDGSVSVLYVTHDQNEAFMVAEHVAVMRSGRIVSSGTIDEVMGLPNDPWLATFFGMADVIEGRVVASQDGLTSVECSGVTIQATGSQPVGTELVLGVRPEDVTIYCGNPPEGGSARNVFAGTIVNVSPIGSLWRVDTRVADDVDVTASVSRASFRDMKLAEGDRVHVSFKASAVLMRPMSELGVPG
jgi:tungstate transport system ATP-binding protein